MMMHGRNGRASGFAMRILAAHLAGVSAEAFAEQELRRMKCHLCAAGLPVVNGAHEIMGLSLPCEAEANQDSAESAEPAAGTTPAGELASLDEALALTTTPATWDFTPGHARAVTEQAGGESATED